MIKVSQYDEPHPIKNYLTDIDMVQILTGAWSCSGLICKVCPFRSDYVDGICHEVNVLIRKRKGIPDWRDE